MSIHQSEDKFPDIERPSTSRAVSPSVSISRYQSRRSSNSKSPSPSDRRTNFSKLKDEDKKCLDEVGDDVTISTSKQKHIDFSYMDVGDKVDALDGIAAIASRYASKRSLDELVSNNNKNKKEKINEDTCSSIERSKRSKSLTKDIFKCKSTNNQQNNYKLSSEKLNRSVKGFRDVYRADYSYREFSPSVGSKPWADTRIKNSWKSASHSPDVSPFEGPSSWDDLRSDISPPRKKTHSSISTLDRNKHSPKYDDNIRHQIRNYPSAFYEEKKQAWPFKDINSWDELRPYSSPYKRRCSSLAPPEKKVWSPYEGPKYWDDLGSYNPISSRGKFISKVNLGKQVLRDETISRKLISVLNCLICEKYFKTKFVFMKHLKSCDAFRTCTVCNTVFKTNNKFKKHLMETGHSRHTDSLQKLNFISIKKFKAAFTNRDVVEESDIFPEGEMSDCDRKKIQKDKFTNEYIAECSRKSINSHGSEEDSKNKEKDPNLDYDKDDYETENSLHDAQINSHMDESYFEEKEERNCLDGLAGIFSQYMGNSSSDVPKKKHKLLENESYKKNNIKDKDVEQETIKKKHKLLENESYKKNNIKDKDVEQETMKKHPKRATAKDFFVDEDPCLDISGVRTYKKQENKTKNIDNDQNNSDHFNNMQMVIHQECEIDYNDNSDFLKSNKPCEGDDRELDVCVEEYSANESGDECENIDESFRECSSAPHGGPDFVINVDNSNSDNNEQISQSESSDDDDNSSNNITFKTQVHESQTEDVIDVISDSDCEIVEQNCSSDVIYDDSSNSSIFETENLESNLENIIENSNSEGTISYITKKMENTETVNNKNNKKINPLSTIHIKGDCEIGKQNFSSEVLDDASSNDSSIFETENLESNLENVIENSNSEGSIAFVTKEREHTKTVYNKNNKKINPLSTEKIKEDSDHSEGDLSEGEETTLIAYSNSKNPILDKIKGPDIIKCEKEGTTTIIEVTNLDREGCPRCSQQLDVTSAIFNVKTGKLSFWCRYCSSLLVTIVKSKTCSKKQKKSNSSKSNIKTKTNKLGNKIKNGQIKKKYKMNCVSESNSLNVSTNENNKNTKKVKSRNKYTKNGTESVKKRTLKYVRHSTRSQKKF